MEAYLSIAGITWRIVLPEEARWISHGTLEGFLIPEPNVWDHTLSLEFCEELPEPDGEEIYRSPDKHLFRAGETRIQYRGAVEQNLGGAYMCLHRQGDHTRVYLKESSFRGEIAAKAVLHALELEHRLAARDGVILHAAWIQRQGRAILFTAPSGVGKSTQADLWCRLRGAELINGDRAAVFADGQVRGIPFAGSSGVCKNEEMPLDAIVFLSQAPATTIAPLLGFRAFRSLWEGCSVASLEREEAQNALETVTELLNRVPVYHLACTPDESAVLALEQLLEKERT